MGRGKQRARQLAEFGLKLSAVRRFAISPAAVRGPVGRIISGALHTLWNSGRIIKPSRGEYQINDNFRVAGPEDSNLLPAPTIASALEKALAFINSYTIKVTDIDDPDTFLYNRKILIETQEFIEKQIARLK